MGPLLPEGCKGVNNLAVPLDQLPDWAGEGRQGWELGAVGSRRPRSAVLPFPRLGEPDGAKSRRRSPRPEPHSAEGRPSVHDRGLRHGRAAGTPRPFLPPGPAASGPAAHPSPPGPRSARPARATPASSPEEPPTASRLFCEGLPDNRPADLSTTERSGKSGSLCLPEEAEMAPEVEGWAREGAVSLADGGPVGRTGQGHAASRRPTLVSLAWSTKGSGPGRGDRGNPAEAALRAARGDVVGAGARWQLPGKPALQFSAAADPGVVGARAEGPPRPHARVAAWGECAPGALSRLIAAVNNLCGLPVPLGHNLRNHSAWPETALTSAGLPVSQYLIPRLPRFASPSPKERA